MRNHICTDCRCHPDGILHRRGTTFIHWETGISMVPTVSNERGWEDWYLSQFQTFPEVRS